MQKAIWLITGGPMQYIAAKKIIDNGYALILSDRNPKATCASLADLFLEIDTFDVDAHIAACKEVKKKFDIKSVVTIAADCHYTVACLAQYLNLHGLDPNISKICRNKIQTRQLLKSIGMYQPDSYIIQSFADVSKFLEENPKKNFVLKASDSSGSRGFQIIQPNKKLTEKQFEYTQQFCSTGHIILEERLLPDPSQISEASVETVWVDGKMYWLNWVDRIFSSDLKFFPAFKLEFTPPEGIELGHVNPGRREFSIKQTVAKLIEQAGCALGLRQQKGGHILKADIFFSTNGPVILELTPRSSGGWDSSGSSPARGADIVGGIIQMSLGELVDLSAWFRYFHYHDAERTAVVLSTISKNAVDCIGRQFTLVSGYSETSKLIELAFQQLGREQYVSI